MKLHDELLRTSLRIDLVTEFHSSISSWSRFRIKNAANNFSLLRKISMAYIKKETKSKIGIKCKRKKACWTEQYLFDVLFVANHSADKPCMQLLTTSV